ncbi:phosphatase PAP2 family protein [Nocardioides flavescens]|uniref:Phosphatase PAP2 family protein n=1 Tax=Nocardioides flavescens TaxID=2691959 RepID=A0A6L7EWU4_9ACTN|nr:phosphatase PAP2 family protein [Nocardioides flavescens]
MRSLPRPVAVAAYAVVLLVWCAVVGIPNDPIGIALWLWLFAVCWRGERSLDFPRDWWPWLLALAVYGLARGLVDDLGWPPHVAWPIRADTWLAQLWGGHTVPTVSLQRELCGDPCSKTGTVRWWDVAASTVYASHFVVGLVLAGVLWLRSREAWRMWMRRYVVLSYVALVGYVVFPMAPPWWAAREGLLPHVARISGRGFHALGIERTTMVFGGLANKTAAMPSLHTGTACLVALWALTRLRSPWRWLVLAYPVAMAATLVYSGEHYLVDTLAGALVAALTMVGCSWWERRQAGTLVSRP